jgi:hypothetical protein
MSLYEGLYGSDVPLADKSDDKASSDKVRSGKVQPTEKPTHTDPLHQLVCVQHLIWPPRFIGIQQASPSARCVLQDVVMWPVACPALKLCTCYVLCAVSK